MHRWWKKSTKRSFCFVLFVIKRLIKGENRTYATFYVISDCHQLLSTKGEAMRQTPLKRKLLSAKLDPEILAVLRFKDNWILEHGCNVKPTNTNKAVKGSLLGWKKGRLHWSHQLPPIIGNFCRRLDVRYK